MAQYGSMIGQCYCLHLGEPQSVCRFVLAADSTLAGFDAKTLLATIPLDPLQQGLERLLLLRPPSTSRCRAECWRVVENTTAKNACFDEAAITTDVVSSHAHSLSLSLSNIYIYIIYIVQYSIYTIFWLSGCLLSLVYWQLTLLDLESSRHQPSRPASVTEHLWDWVASHVTGHFCAHS